MKLHIFERDIYKDFLKIYFYLVFFFTKFHKYLSLNHSDIALTEKLICLLTTVLHQITVATPSYLSPCTFSNSEVEQPLRPHLSSTMTVRSFFSAASRFCVCNRNLSTVTQCCFFCSSMSRSRVCRLSVLEHSLRKYTSAQSNMLVCLNHCSDHYPHTYNTHTCTRMCAHDVLTRLSSKCLLSSSHLSRDVWRSCSSPSREVT